MTVYYKLFLDGEWVSGKSALSITNPANLTHAAKVAMVSAEQLDLALLSASSAFARWKSTPASKRGDYLCRAAKILETKIRTVSLATCREQGKPVFEAIGELQRAVETLQWCGENAERLCAAIPMEGARLKVPEPLGVVAAFTPWNYPAVISARKVAAPLAAGCPVILKAAEESPACAVAIIEALDEAGIPKGVVNLVFGDPPFISETLMSSESVRVVSFTGSTAVGKQLARKAADNLQQCVLELGGHAPVLIFSDADLPRAAKEISDYKFETAGQSCNAPSRIFVEASVYEDFLMEFQRVVNEISVGNGEDPATTMGPMIGQRAIDRMENLKRDALERGAKAIEYSGQMPESGYFWRPTILTNVAPEARVMWEEPFGPLVPVLPFDTLDEAVQLANASDYGLAAYVFSTSEDIQKKIVKSLNVGSISINMLRGVRADVINPGIGNSGYGYEGGDEGFRAFQNLKLVNGSMPTLDLE
ncbi:MAG: aldehyde dehydrogenase family protein [Sneathiellales bacterium]|nr:aldehyde dehydrogenase family protein [Sneathiellales bacterium]